MDIDKLFESESLDGIADNVFGVVNNSVSEVKEMQRKKVAENVQLVVNALKKIESDISSRYDSVGNALEKRIITIKDGRDGADGRDGRNGKDGKNGRDGAPGPRGADGKNGLDGADGTDGVSVTDARIDFDGSLVISLSSGQEINVGEVVAPALAEQIKVITNGGGTSQSVIDTLASLQAQITAISGASVYKGLWNASTNTPTLASGVGTSGNFYIVSVAGSTNLDGITNWGVGDWAIYNGTAWQRVEGGAAGNFTTVTASSLTSGRVTYAGTAGLLQDSANLTFNGTTLTANTIGAFTLGGTVAGGGNQLNNVIIGTTTPLAGAFTTLSANDNTVLASVGNTKTVQIGSLAAPANVGQLQQVFNGAAAWGSQSTVGGETDFGWNFYHYGGFKSRLADVASRLSFNAVSGRVSFWTAPNPGSADAALTFTEALRIDATTGVTALGAMAVGNNLAVTGTLTSTLGATIYGVTVGRGGGAVSTNTVLGNAAFASNLTGGYSVAIGTQALQVSTAGYNTAVGYQSQLLTNTGQSNVSVGYYSLVSNTSGGSNTAIGTFALGGNTTASNNTAVGYQAGYSGTAFASGSITALGYKAGYSATAGRITAVGESALAAAAGAGNTAVGYAAGSTTTGVSNTYLGDYAGVFVTTGTYNVCIGYLAGYQNNSPALTTGSGNVIIGASSTGIGVSAVGDNNSVVIGYSIQGKGSNTAYIGGSSGAYNQANVTTWATTSDQRIKKNIIDVTNGLSVITALRPVEFDYKENNKHEVGFIAQEYQQVLPDQIIQHAANEAEKEWVDDDGKVFGIQQNLVPYLVKAIQELKAEFDAYKSTHP